MNFRDFLIQKKDEFLDVLIKTQIKQVVEYSYEGNMEAGVAYQDAILTIGEPLYSTNQQFRDIKHDILFCFEDFPCEAGEIKTGYYDFNKRYKQNRKKWGDPCAPENGKLYWQRVPYRKYKGDSGFDIEGTLPDWILVYQKFKIEKKVPAALGFIEKARIKLIFDEKRYEDTRGDLILRINREDFSLFYVRSFIPQVSDNLAEKLLENEAECKALLLAANDEALQKSFTGKYYELNGTTLGTLDGRSLTESDKSYILSLKNEGFSLDDISKLSGYTIKAVHNVISAF